MSPLLPPMSLPWKRQKVRSLNLILLLQLAKFSKVRALACLKYKTITILTSGKILKNRMFSAAAGSRFKMSLYSRVRPKKEQLDEIKG